MNGSDRLERYQSLLETMKGNLEIAENLAESVEGNLSHLDVQKGDLDNNLQEKVLELEFVQEKLKQLDDMTGSDDEILERLRSVEVYLIVNVN